MALKILFKMICLFVRFFFIQPEYKRRARVRKEDFYRQKDFGNRNNVIDAEFKVIE